MYGDIFSDETTGKVGMRKAKQAILHKGGGAALEALEALPEEGQAEALEGQAEALEALEALEEGQAEASGTVTNGLESAIDLIAKEEGLEQVPETEQVAVVSKEG